MPARKTGISVERLRALLSGINEFGCNAQTGGFNRTGYSEADMAARRWFAAQMQRDGLSVNTDAVANVFGRFGPADGPAILVGSHLDTVPEGGAFDGALGVAVALECVRTMRDAGYVPSRAIEVVATAEEEGRFGGMLGSQAIAGAVPDGFVGSAVAPDGTRLADAMRAQGLEPDNVPAAARPASDIRAFLELHIEQGPVLETTGIPVAVADRISGVCYLVVTLTGIANHSGTTPMDLRADAFRGLADVAAGIPKAIGESGTDQSRITIGKVELAPNYPHTIPGLAEFSIIIRDTDVAVMQALTERMTAAVERAAAAHDLAHSIETRSFLPPVALDRNLVALLCEEAERLGLPVKTMPSGAGHDAQTMQAICPSALVFVPSRGGISHAPAEWTDWDDIERGANLMLAALIRLSGAQ